MEKENNLYHHQKSILGKSPQKLLLAHSTGLGKTRTAIELIRLNKPTSTLIICPKGLKSQWEAQCAKWGLDTPYRVISKEEFKKEVNNKTFVVPVALISDEHHNTLGMTSQIGKYFKLLTPRVKYFYALTATPFRSSPWDIYMLCLHFGIKLDYKKFQEKFFQLVKFGRRPVWIPRKNWKDLENLKPIIKSFSDFKEMSECFDVPEQIDDFVYFDYRYEKSEDIPIVAFTKDHIEEALCREKLEYVKEIVENNDRVVIVCKYLEQIEMYRKVFVDALVISGETKDRGEIVIEANRREKCIVIVSSGCCEGYELPDYPIMIFVSNGYSYVEYKQMRGRILRANNLKKNLYIHLQCRGGADEAVWDNLKDKQDFSTYLYTR